jgi:zinc protease
MKKVFLFILLFSSACLFAQDAELRFPHYDKKMLQNGLTLLLMEQHEVPIVSFQLILRSGTTVDPPGKEGLSSLTIGMLRKGTKTRSANQISSQLDFIGGLLNESADSDYCSLSAEFLKKDLIQGINLLSDIVLNPVFPKAELEKMSRQRIDEIVGAKDDADSVIDYYYASYLFGKHPYGRSVDGDEKSLASVIRADVVAHYQKVYKPGNIILAVVGDFKSAEMESLLRKRFEGWMNQPVPQPELPQPAPVQGKRLLLINKPDSTQTFYKIGNIGSWRTNPDRVFIRVVNTLFGGRYTSILNSELRINSGLTYGANSSFDNRKVRGPFNIESFTSNETTVKAIDLTLDLLRRLHEKGITQQDLDSAKNYIKGQFPLQMETTNQLAFVIAEWELYGLDSSEVTNLYKTLNAMTLVDAKRVIHEYFPSDNLVFVLIGKASEIEEAVKKYAQKIDRKEITTPGF